MDIKIEYNGSYPNLCSGTLVVTIGKKCWEFPPFCLSSGGYASFTDEGDGYVVPGPWSVEEWPDGFPVKHKMQVEHAINAKIPHGCCGGCL